MSEPSVLNSTGNCFALVDGFVGPWPEDPAAAARERCGGSERLHGMLLVGPPQRRGHARMRIYNADGTRAEMCGNGLRCVAKFLWEQGYARHAEIVVETDCGQRRAWPRLRDDTVHAVRAEVGLCEVVELRRVLDVGGGAVELTHVRVGNPHAVIFVEDEGAAPLETLGPALEKHPAFPGGVNVHFAAPRGRNLGMRSWERGVGETPACGTGAAAAAAAAIRLGLAVSPVWVDSPGGTLEVEWSPWESAVQTGAVAEGREPARSEDSPSEQPG